MPSVDDAFDGSYGPEGPRHLVKKPLSEKGRITLKLCIWAAFGGLGGIMALIKYHEAMKGGTLYYVAIAVAAAAVGDLVYTDRVRPGRISDGKYTSALWINFATLVAALVLATGSSLEYQWLIYLLSILAGLYGAYLGAKSE
ncbi:hypothetical protein ABT404_17945 [Streptomyces hyaluromycini]|uniref:DUF2231 domain-containing protein n=1 Tax=Streptomyces hyaluromycini TaxID=1377993 RepID=A0ABV1WX30_9ACTN